MAGNNKSLDPLYQLFEHYLLNRSYEDSAKFTKEIAQEYLSYLDSTPAHVPFHSRALVIEDLESEARELLVKKMYGCIRPADYARSGKVLKVEDDESLAPQELGTPEVNEDNSPKKG